MNLSISFLGERVSQVGAPFPETGSSLSHLGETLPKMDRRVPPMNQTRSNVPLAISLARTRISSDPKRRIPMKSSYADQINAARLLLGGLRNHATALARRGLDAAFTTNLDTLLTDAQTLNGEQEALKSRLAEKTTALNAKLDQLRKAASEVKKVAKLDLPKESWREFGITDSR